MPNLRTISKDLLQLQGRKYNLIETLARDVAYICTIPHNCGAVEVRIEKPSSLNFTKGTAVELKRRKEDFKKHRVLLSIGSNIDPEKKYREMPNPSRSSWYCC